MIHYLTLDDVLELHSRAIKEFGGDAGVRDLGLVESAVALPRAAFFGKDAYTTLASKAATLAYSLIKNHAFYDGNKRVGAASFATFLHMNGQVLDCTADEGEAVVLGVATGTISREQLATWIEERCRPVDA